MDVIKNVIQRRLLRRLTTCTRLRQHVPRETFASYAHANEKFHFQIYELIYYYPHYHSTFRLPTTSHNIWPSTQHWHLTTFHGSRWPSGITIIPRRNAHMQIIPNTGPHKKNEQKLQLIDILNIRQQKDGNQKNNFTGYITITKTHQRLQILH